MKGQHLAAGSLQKGEHNAIESQKCSDRTKDGTSLWFYASVQISS
jgi:hypothetical protein